MHDATEGGVLGGLAEMADASGKAFVFREDLILRNEEAEAVCSAYGVDPLASLSEGTLLITCDPAVERRLVGKLGKRGIKAAAVGEVRKGRGLWMSVGRRRPRKVERRADPYWGAYSKAERLNLK
jgi:hydrogenase maturation factor